MITTGSGLERFISCRLSTVLPRAFDEGGSKYAARGTAVHEFLQRVTEGTSREDALEMVEDRHHDACAAIDLEKLDDVLGLTAEIALAYNPTNDTARVLGVALDRQYVAAGLTDDEIPMSLDVAGLDDPSNPRRGTVVDYKTGYSKLAPAHRNWQMRGGALALARAFDLDIVDVQLIHLREDSEPRRDRAVFEAADFAMFAAEAKVRWELALADRARHAATGVQPDATMGSWCGYCPSYFACEPKIAMVRAIGSREEVDGMAAIMPIPQDRVAEAWRRLGQFDEARKRVKSAVLAAARERPALLETMPDGTQMWLGITEVVGNEKLKPELARIVAKEMLDAEAVDEISKYTVTKDLLDKAIKKRVPRGHGAEKMRAVIGELRKRGGVSRPVKHEVDVYPIKPQQLAAKAGMP